MKHIAIISPNKSAWSETFIRAQVEGLPAEVHFLYGAYLPRYRPDDRHFISDWYLMEGWAYAKDRILRRELHATLRGRIAKYLRKNKVQAVLAQYGPTGVEMMDLCAHRQIPLIVHFHGFDVYDEELLSEYGARYPELFRLADALIVVSRHMENKLLTWGAPREKLHYNPCGADTHLFHPVKAGDNPPQFLAAGRFSETKSPHLTLLAFAQVLKKVPEARLKIAGGGLLYHACKTMIKGLNLEHAVELPGVVSHHEMAYLMRGSRAFVQHSVTTPTGDSEGTPVAIMEAGAAGIPVVSTRHAGIPDVVLHEKTGLLVDECDVEGMAYEMTRLAEDPSLATRLGQAAVQHVNVEFALEQRLKNLWKIMQEAMK